MGPSLLYRRLALGVLLATFAQLVILLRNSQIKDYMSLLSASAERNWRAFGEEIYKVNRSMIHDPTLEWDPTVNRMWLNPARLNQPPAMLLLTSYGWNQANQEHALKEFGRRIRETELMQGVINHRWFHPTAWEDYENHNASFVGHLIEATSTRFYVFLDFNTYDEWHYPLYHAHDLNLDTKGGRVNIEKGRVDLDWIALEKIWSSRWVRTVPHDRIKVVAFDGGGWGPDPGNRNRNLPLTDGVPTWNLPLAMVAISALLTNVNQSVDQGLMPPMIKKTQLTESQVQDIYSCKAERRRFFLTYTGNLRSGMSKIFQARGNFHNHKLDDGKSILIRRNFLPEYNESIVGNLTYEDVLSNSVFSLAARGDNKYSYKFSETLSAGAIPVVLADDWMYPFRPELVDWSECAVIMPEKDSGKPTMALLLAMSEERRCRMRQRCYEIYRKYVEHPEGVLDGIVQGLELVAEGVRRPMVGVQCKLGEGVWKGEGWLREENVSEPDVRLCNLM